MVVATETDLRADILEWMDAAFGETSDLATAAARVADRVVKEGHADAFVRELGPEVLTYWWRHGNQASRRTAASPGERRVDVEAVRESLLEQLYKIGDEWVRRGDCNKAMCRQAQKFFHGQAEGNMREAYTWSKLADGLKGDDQLVRAVFSDEQIRGFLAGFRLE